jgi:phage repressor protein C with HTH and peptisase S24 domain
MLKHEEIWRAIDHLAAMHRLTPSGLARRAGLDPTTFNKSKRLAKDGKARWPSTESLAKILNATGASITEFIGLMRNGGGPPKENGAKDNGESGAHSIPLLLLGEPPPQGLFDPSGRLMAERLERIEAPDIGIVDAFAIKIAGIGYQPTYRSGDILIAAPAAEPEGGSRALLVMKDGSVLLREVLHRTGDEVIVRPVNKSGEVDVLRASSVATMARIVWARQ